MNRRKFVKYSLGTIASIPLLASPQIALPFGPLFFLRFLFSRSALRMLGTASRRTVIRNSIARGSRLRTLRSFASPRKMYPTAPLIKAGVEIGGISAMSPDLFKIVINHNATTVWVMDDAKPEEFFISGKNNTNETISAPLGVGYNELGVTGKQTEYYDHGKLTVEPNEHFAIKLSPPNELGGMRLIDLHGQLLGIDNSMVEFEKSDPVVIARSWEVAR